MVGGLLTLLFRVNMQILKAKPLLTLTIRVNNLPNSPDRGGVNHGGQISTTLSVVKHIRALTLLTNHVMR